MIGPDERERIEEVVGRPAAVDNLKVKPGRRTTARATGPRGSVIVKVYASQRAQVVAARVAALRGGPDQPEVPRLLAFDADRRMVVLSDVPGTALSHALLRGDGTACRRAGRALGIWHRAFEDAAPEALRPHTSDREAEILARWAACAEPRLAERVRAAAEDLLPRWEPRTVVHRDLYEEQILVASGGIGLIDLDDAALGPPELDLGNALAHMTLLQRVSGRDLGTAMDEFLGGYHRSGPDLDDDLLARLRRGSLLRLACIHGRADLLEECRCGGPGVQRTARAPHRKREATAISAR